MSIFDLFYKPSKDCVQAYEKLKNNEFCLFYLRKIPKYCAIDKILWMEADVIENNIVKSFRINYFHPRLNENVDIKVRFSHYHHEGLPIEQFNDMMKFLSIAMANKKFVFAERGSSDFETGSVYNRKYAKRMFGI